MTPDALQAVESIRKAVETSDRPEAAQGVVEVARVAILKGHGPGRVGDLVREAMKPGVTNPGGWLRRVIEMRGADEGGVLRDRPKPPPPPTLPISVATEDDIRRSRTRTYGCRPKAAGGAK